MVALTRPRPSAWILNLDADYELEAPAAHTPSARTAAKLPELVRTLGALFGPEDVVLNEADRLTNEPAGRAWCPTPSAIRRLQRAGAVPVPAPEFAILRRVNHRGFSAELGQTLPGARYVTRIEELAATIALASPTGHWLLKRPFGFAGRGRRRVAQGSLDPSAQSWVRASFDSRGGLQVEPWVDRGGDFALHGFLSQDGAITLGEPTRQSCDETGAWKETSLSTDLERAEQAALRSSTTLAAEALARAGYFGPFGIDAFRWRRGASLDFNSRSEINARYSMGWAKGMEGRRVDLD